MKKFILLFHGHAPQTTHRRVAWNRWLNHRACDVVDVGHQFGRGRRITDETTEEFSLASNQTSGFSIVSARHIDAAEQLLEGCPIVDSITVYELLPPDRFGR